jgi:hypothetical protein
MGVYQRTERWAQSLKRMSQGELIRLYNIDTERFDKQQKQRTCLGGTEANASQHPIEEYVDLFFPETIMWNGEVPSQKAITARKDRKKDFKNMVQTKKPWVEFNERYGKGVFPLLAEGLKEDQ